MMHSVLIFSLTVLWATGAVGHQHYPYGTNNAVHLADQYRDYPTGTYNPYVSDDYGYRYDSYGDGYVLDDYGSDENVAYVLVDDKDPYGQYGEYGVYHSVYEPYDGYDKYAEEYPLVSYYPKETDKSYERYDNYGREVYDRYEPSVTYGAYDEYNDYNDYLPSYSYDQYNKYNYGTYGGSDYAYGYQSDKLYEDGSEAYYGYKGEGGYGPYEDEHGEYGYQDRDYDEYGHDEYEPTYENHHKYREQYGIYRPLKKDDKYTMDGGYTKYDKKLENGKYDVYDKYSTYNDYVYAKYRSPPIDDYKGYGHKYYAMGQGYKHFKPYIAGNKHYETYGGLINYEPHHTKKHENSYDYSDYRSGHDYDYDVAEQTDDYSKMALYGGGGEKFNEYYGKYNEYGDGKFYDSYGHYGKYDNHGHDGLSGEYGTDGYLNANDKLMQDDRYLVHGGIQGHGKASGFKESEKGLKYEEVTSFHKGGSVDTYGKHKERYGGYDTQGKIKQYGDEFARQKYLFKGDLRAKGKGGRYGDEDAKAKFTLHTRVTDYQKNNRYGKRSNSGHKRGGEEMEFYGDVRGHSDFGSYDKERGYRNFDDYGKY